MNYMELKQNRSDSVYSEILMVDRQYALGDIARLFQRITENAMDKLGTGYYQLKEKELIWVICFSDIRIKRMPAEGETIEIYSWPGKDRFGMYSRRYAMYTGDGESLITCASLFSIVDQNTRKMIASGDAGFSFPVVEFADEPPLPKMNEKGGVTSQVQQHAVSVHEIDKNDHVNNSFYLDWAENLSERNAGHSGHAVTCMDLLSGHLTRLLLSRLMARWGLLDCEENRREIMALTERERAAWPRFSFRADDELKEEPLDFETAQAAARLAAEAMDVLERAESAVRLAGNALDCLWFRRAAKNAVNDCRSVVKEVQEAHGNAVLEGICCERRAWETE